MSRDIYLFPKNWTSFWKILSKDYINYQKTILKRLLCFSQQRFNPHPKGSNKKPNTDFLQHWKGMFITIQNKHENHKRQQIRPMHNHIKRAICPCGLTGFKKGLFNPLQDIKIKKLGRFRPCNKEQHHKQKLPFPMYSFITNLRQ